MLGSEITPQTPTKLNWKWLAPLVFTFLLIYWLQKNVLSNPEEVSAWMEVYGAWAILGYIVLQGLTIIVAPLGGVTMQIAVIGILGPLWGAVVVNLVSTPFYLLNFLLAKKFGAKFIPRFIGKEGMDSVNLYINNLGNLVLFLLRTANSSYDFAAYAAGLTSMRFSKYALVTVLGALSNIIFLYLVFEWAGSLTTGYLVMQISTMVIIGTLTTHFMLKQEKEKRK